MGHSMKIWIIVLLSAFGSSNSIEGPNNLDKPLTYRRNTGESSSFHTGKKLEDTGLILQPTGDNGAQTFAAQIADNEINELAKQGQDELDQRGERKGATPLHHQRGGSVNKKIEQGKVERHTTGEQMVDLANTHSGKTVNQTVPSVKSLQGRPNQYDSMTVTVAANTASKSQNSGAAVKLRSSSSGATVQQPAYQSSTSQMDNKTPCTDSSSCGKTSESLLTRITGISTSSSKTANPIRSHVDQHKSNPEGPKIQPSFHSIPSAQFHKNETGRNSVGTPTIFERDDDVSQLALVNETQSGTGDTNQEPLDLDVNEPSDQSNGFTVTFTEPTHGDDFRCDNCSCSHTQKRFIIANCSARYFIDIPLTLPTDTWFLNLTQNRLKEINHDRLPQYPILKEVYISYNYVEYIRNCSVRNVSYEIDLLDLSSNKIKEIDDNAFANMAVLRNLSLKFNQLTVIQNLTFSGLPKLRILDLGYNGISHIEYGAFDNLPQLKELSLAHNKRLSYYPRRFNPRLFVNTQRLSTLYIQGSSNGATRYPSQALSKAQNLQNLVIDGIGKGVHFGKEMKTLKHLRKLTFGRRGFCQIKQLNKTFFENTPHLEELSIDKCIVRNVDPEAFQNLTKLHTYRLSYLIGYNLSEAFGSLQYLQNSSLRVISFIHVHHSQRPCYSLGAAEARYLQHTQIKILDISNNRLSLLGDDFMNMLPPTLEQLILRGNKITVPIFLISSHGFYQLKKLSLIDFTGQNFDTESPQNYEGNLHFTNNSDISEMEPVYSVALDTQRTPSQCDGRFRGNLPCPSVKQGPINKRLRLPPALKTLLASYYIKFGSIILQHQLYHSCVLEEVDFSSSFLSDWGSGTLSRTIKRAALDDNFCMKIEPSFLSDENRLEKLSIRNNLLGDSFANDFNGTIFQKATQLVYLDASNNQIYRLPQNVFKGLTNIRTILLKGNKIRMLNINIAHMTKLSYLDLSNNAIMWISEKTRRDLDSIAVRHTNGIRIDFTHNPLPCTCAGLKIIQWMATTKVYIENSDYLQCTYDDGTVDYVGNFTLRVDSLQRACAPLKTIIQVAIVFLSIFIIVLGLGFSVRYKWKLRYYKNHYITKFFGHRSKRQLTDGNYNFDAYLPYAEEDREFVLYTCLQELEVKRGHRLCVEDRNFMPGSFMSNNIICAVQSSALTVPIVSPDFYSEEHSEYAIKMALCESLHKKRKTLHLCLYQHVPEEKLSTDFLMALKNGHYTEMPPEDEELSEAARQTFWDNLSNAIGHHGNRDLPAQLEA